MRGCSGYVEISRLAVLLFATVAGNLGASPPIPPSTQPAAALRSSSIPEPIETPGAPGPRIRITPTPRSPVRVEPANTSAMSQNIDIGPTQVLQPIDLGNTLSLAGARALDIAIARQRVSEALADLSQARALWLPSLFYGPTWYRADGQIQTVTGQVQNINRNSLFLGGMAATANGFAAPSPGTGYPPLNGMSSVLRFSDAIYLPMAARRAAAASRANVQAVTNNTLLSVVEAYFDLQVSAGQLAIAREAAGNAERLVEITTAYAGTGQGKVADLRRARAELNHQRKLIRMSVGQLQVASTNLVRLLVLDPNLVLAPVEPAETVVRLIPEEIPLDALILQGMANRPELAQSRELLQAAQVRAQQAKLRPFIPSLGLTYAGGGFGGGQAGFFGNFGARGDVAASLFWELTNLGFTDRAIALQRAAQSRIASIELTKVGTEVAADVGAAYQLRRAAALQITESTKTVAEAVESLQLNFLDMREGVNLPRATRPLEVLQPIQALAQARTDYLDSVITYNRAQFRLKRAVGQAP